jgi:hypothetical protein
MQSRSNATIGVNPIVTKNNTIVTLHLDDEERGSKRLAPYGELHGNDTPVFHRVVPHAVKRPIGLHELVILTSKLIEDGVRHQVDSRTAIDKHPRNRLPVDVTLNVQQLQVMASFFSLLEHDLLGVEKYLSDLILVTPELGWQCEHHLDVHVGGRWRSILDQRRLIVVQQVHVVGGRDCRGAGLLLHPLFLLHQDHRPDSVEVLISILLGRFLPYLLCSHPLDPPSLARRES